MTIFGCFRWVVSKKWFYFAIASPTLPYDGLEFVSIEYWRNKSYDGYNSPFFRLMIGTKFLTVRLDTAQDLTTRELDLGGKHK